MQLRVLATNKIQHTDAQHIFQSLVQTFNLIVYLRVEGRTKVKAGTQHFLESAPKCWRKAWVLIRHYRHQKSIQPYNFFHVQLCLVIYRNVVLLGRKCADLWTTMKSIAMFFHFHFNTLRVAIIMLSSI